MKYQLVAHFDIDNKHIKQILAQNIPFESFAMAMRIALIQYCHYRTEELKVEEDKEHDKLY